MIRCLSSYSQSIRSEDTEIVGAPGARPGADRYSQSIRSEDTEIIAAHVHPALFSVVTASRSDLRILK